MSEISEKQEISRFIEQKATNGALMVSGKWGCGKTYYLKKLAEEYNQKGKFIVVIISLFGLDTVASLHRAVKKAVFLSANLSDSMSGKITCLQNKLSVFKPVFAAFKDSSKVFKNINTAITIDWSEFIDVEKKIKNVSDENGASRELVLVFDDFERSKINLIDLMGAINEYIENKEIKVIFVANEEEITSESKERYSKIKEKLIARTIPLKINITDVATSLIESYKETEYKEFLLKYQPVLEQVFKDSQSDNIRSFKSILIDFERVYACWQKSGIIMENYIDEALYQFAALEYEHKNGRNSVPDIFSLAPKSDNALSDGIILVGNYRRGIFNKPLPSLVNYIQKGKWNEIDFISDLKGRLVCDAMTPAQVFLHQFFWKMQQSDIVMGMPRALHAAYAGNLCCDDMLELLIRVHEMKINGITFPCEVDYIRITAGFEVRKKQIISGLVSEPQRRKYLNNEHMDDEAIELYNKIDHLYDQLPAWKTRQEFISLINNQSQKSHFYFNKKYLESFDDELLKVFVDSYKVSPNEAKWDMKMALSVICFDDCNHSTQQDIELTVNNLKSLQTAIEGINKTESDQIAVAIGNSCIKLIDDKLEDIENCYRQNE